MTEIFYVDNNIKVVKQRNTKRAKMDWYGGMFVTMNKAELVHYLGPAVWDVYDSERHPSLKMRGGKVGSRRELILHGTVKEDYFLRKHRKKRTFEEALEMTEEDSEQDFDLNRFKNEKMSIDCSNYAGQPHQLGRFGHFYRSEDENYGMSMWLDLPDDSMQFLYRNKKYYENFEAYFVFHRKWGGPDAPEDWEEPYYKNPNSFDCDVTSCQFTFTDEFGNKKEKKTKTKKRY